MARKKTPKQTTIEGTQRKAIPAIRKAAETYVEIRDERMEFTEREVEANEKLVQVMVKHDVTDYVQQVLDRGADNGE